MFTSHELKRIIISDCTPYLWSARFTSSWWGFFPGDYWSTLWWLPQSLFYWLVKFIYLLLYLMSVRCLCFFSTFRLYVETKCSSFSFNTVNCDWASHLLNHFFTNAETEACPRWIHLSMFVKLWEVLKELFQIFFANPYTCIYNLYSELYVEFNILWLWALTFGILMNWVDLTRLTLVF